MRVKLGPNGVPIFVDTKEAHSHNALTEGVGDHGAVTVGVPHERGACYSHYQVSSGSNEKEE